MNGHGAAVGTAAYVIWRGDGRLHLSMLFCHDQQGSGSSSFDRPRGLLPRDAPGDDGSKATRMEQDRPNQVNP